MMATVMDIGDMVITGMMAAIMDTMAAITDMMAAIMGMMAATTDMTTNI
jgi:hypothetical protein